MEIRELRNIVTGLKNIVLPASLAQKKWEEALLFLVPSWQRKGTQIKGLK